MKWAVSYIDWHNYNLTTVFVEAEDWRQALVLHPEIANCAEDLELKTLESTKQEFFDMDSMIEVVEVPE